MSTIPQGCPGFERIKHLTSFTCKCPECGEEAEIFSDEYQKEHHCKGCGKEIDFSKCELYASA